MAVGSIACHQAFGLTIIAKHYSAKRQYYITRNRLVMVQRFWKERPVGAVARYRDIVKDTIKVALLKRSGGINLRIPPVASATRVCGRTGKVI